VDVAIDDFKELLEACIAGDDDGKKHKTLPPVVSYENRSQENAPRFRVTFRAGYLASVSGDLDRFEADLKLTRKLSSTNMHLHDAACTITKYETPLDILRAFFAVRLELYGARKRHLEAKLGKELGVLSTKVRFLSEIMSGELEVFRRKRAEVEASLDARGYERLDDGFGFLTTMPVHSFTEEKIAELVASRAAKQHALALLQATSDRQLWTADLERLEAAYTKWNLSNLSLNDAPGGSGATVRKAVKRKAKASPVP
jgi:hypothetical protein